MNYFLLGQRIRQQRNSLHISQAELAERIDVSTNFIGQIERGDRKPSLETLVSLCNAMGVSMDYILSDNIDRTEDQLTFDIINKLSPLPIDDKEFLYHTINNYSNLLEKKRKNSQE